MNKIKELQKEYDGMNISSTYNTFKRDQKKLKSLGIVVVYGHSDDCVEFEGAIYDETYNVENYVTGNGLLENDCSDDECPFFERYKDALIKSGEAKLITAKYGNGNGTWKIETDIPHLKFKIIEQCRDEILENDGILFYLSQV
jgi:hypothetical protein